ncbi:MAG TPA: WecB/TagA/CpsF family glycosyltransferase [Acidocella sp.]|jgi:N-acetylglucosaminyldiphosphoundecaprenol N-acetyl-beta-D-mannosaminyltransferase|nr:WecB/TagA/CpsF family glycosyltransferase [Acidocella sp.]
MPDLTATARSGGPDEREPALPDNPVDIMGLRLHDLHRDVIAQRVIAAVRLRQKLLVVNANAHLVVLSQRSPWIRALFLKADIAFCDGAGVQLALRLLRGRWAHRTTPPEWIGAVLSALRSDASIFWIGGHPDVVAKAASRYEALYGVRTAGIQHGYFDMSAQSSEAASLLQRINQAAPSILLVNMGMPRQERWVLENWDELRTGVVITAGALVDHAAGRVRRPPRWVANLGLEWLVRLVIEPRRLWRRYLLGLPVFGFYVLRYAAHAQTMKAAFDGGYRRRVIELITRLFHPEDRR